MSTFSFRLEKILRLRTLEETEKARALGNALAQAEALRREHEEAEARLARCREQMAEGAEGPRAAGHLRNLHLTLGAAEDLAREAGRRQEASEEVVEEAREEFGEARKDRRVLENLEDRARGAWMADASRDEQRECDGVARQRWLRGGES
jgi:flagellar export protein FliJ